MIEERDKDLCVFGQPCLEYEVLLHMIGRIHKKAREGKAFVVADAIRDMMDTLGYDVVVWPDQTSHVHAQMRPPGYRVRRERINREPFTCDAVHPTGGRAKFEIPPKYARGGSHVRCIHYDFCLWHFLDNLPSGKFPQVSP